MLRGGGLGLGVGGRRGVFVARRYVSGRGEGKALQDEREWRRMFRLLRCAGGYSHLPSELLERGQGYLWIGQQGASKPVLVSPVYPVELFRAMEEEEDASSFEAETTLEGKSSSEEASN